MNINFRNIGPIKSIDISLDKKVYVFVGYNNSGKTYASYLMWKLNKEEFYPQIFIDDHLLSIEYFYIEKSHTLIVNDKHIKDFFDSFQHQYLETLPELLNIPKSSISIENSQIIFKGDFYKRFYKKYYRAIAGGKDSSGIERSFLIEKINESDKLIITEIDNNKYNPRDYFTIHNLSLSILIQGDLKTTVAEVLSYFMIRALYNRDEQLPFFLPANRIFFLSYFKYINSTESREYQSLRRTVKSNFSIGPDSISNYPHNEPVNQVIRYLDNLNSPHNRSNSYYPDLVDELEIIISGKINVKENNNNVTPTEFQMELKSGEKIDMYLASSSSNQLALLYLYLKYWAHETDNFLVIDEPEENIHPKLQIQVANILLKFADKNNNRILINTHSPIVAETINNNLFYSYIKENSPHNLSEIDSDNLYVNNSLSSDDYGIYFFENGGSVEYRTGKYGINFKDFVKEEKRVSEMSDRLRGIISEIQ